MNTILAGICTRRWRRISVAVFTFLVLACMARADVVTDWNKNAENAILSSNSLKGNSIGAARVYVLMHAAIFDAVNGIKPHFTPYHVHLPAPKGASARAAAIQAAYVVLVSLIPSQKSTFDAERAASLASLADDADDDGSTDGMAIARGLAWGELVANDILTWRSTDGFSRVLPAVARGSAPAQWPAPPPPVLPHD